MTIEEQIYRHAISQPEKRCVVCGSTSLTYAQLWSQVMQARDWYVSQGIPAGSRILISADKSAGFIAWYLGAHMAGMICVPVDPETNAARLQRIVTCARPTLMLGALRYGTDYEVLPYPDTDPDAKMEGSPEFPDKDGIADLMFTTGTTGMPKGVALSYANQEAAAGSINSFVGNTGEDVELLALPISHSFGLGRMRCVLSTGGTLVLIPGFASMKKFFGAIEEHGVTGFGMVPASWAYISKMSGDRIGNFASQLRYIEIGSAYMPVAEKERLMSLLPETRICMHYGLTEASRSTFLCFGDSRERLESAGRPSPGVDVAIFNPDGTRSAVGIDGEVCVKGAHVCADYWEMPREDFARDFHGEYFKTGDLGHLDAEGYLYLAGRAKEIINVGGKKVSPQEVEEVLNAIQGVRESACVGVHDPVMGEVVKAFIVAADNCPDDDAIRKEVAGKLENYKVPAEIEHIQELPKTSSGKLQRLKLK